MKKPQSPSPAASTATRQTSDRVSTDAAKLLEMAKRGRFEWIERLTHGMVRTHSVTRLVKSVAASALNQDQTKGQRPVKRKRGKGKR